MLENKEQEKIAGIISDFFDGAVNEADIDILAIKIYEKYVAELEQDLGFTTKTANELIEIKHKLEQDRDTWKRACELACNYMCKFVIPCPDIHRKECESFCNLNKADCYKDYFFQQAKKDWNDE